MQRASVRLATGHLLIEHRYPLALQIVRHHWQALADAPSVQLIGQCAESAECQRKLAQVDRGQQEVQLVSLAGQRHVRGE